MRDLRLPDAPQLRELGDERRLVVEAAQIEDQRAVLDAADDRNGQATEAPSQGLEPAASALAVRRARWRCRRSAAFPAAARPSRSGSRSRRLPRDSASPTAAAIGCAQPRAASARSRPSGARRSAASAASRPAGRDRGRACSVASSAASRILSRRSARFIGFLATRATRSLRPAMMPACGPPSSLSPEKVTRSAPSASASRTVGSGAQTVAREIDQRAGAQVVDEREPCARAPARTARPPAPTSVKPWIT